MDKNKNRSDLLAAGRKKLQQYRKKKDHKGSSSSHGKSSSKASKIENDGDVEEPSKMPEPHRDTDADESSTDRSDPLADVRLVDASSLPSSEGKRDEEEHTAVSLHGAMQEATHLGSQPCNVERLEYKSDGADGSSPDLPPDAEGTIEDVSIVPSYGPEVAKEMDGSSPSEMSNEGTGGTSGSSKTKDERDVKQLESEEYEIERCTLDEETSSLIPEATQSSTEVGKYEDAGMDLPDKSEKHTYEHLDGKSMSQGISSTKGGDGAVAVDAEVEKSNVEETVPPHLSEHDITYNKTGPSSDLAEEHILSSRYTSSEVEETNSMPSSGESSSHDSLATEGKDCSVTADEDGETRGEVVLQATRYQETCGLSVPEKVVSEGERNLCYNPQGISSVEETSETISSSSQGNPIIHGAAGPSAADLIGSGSYSEEATQQSRIMQEADMCSNPVEMRQVANGSPVNKPIKSIQSEENLETVPSFSEDIPVADWVNCAASSVSEEEQINIGRSMVQSSHWDYASAETKSAEKLPEQNVTSVGKKDEGINKEDLPLGSCNGGVEDIRNLLCITIVERNILQLQLDEQVELNVENQQQSFVEVSKAWNLVKETQESKEMINKEVEQLRTALQAMLTAKEEIETRCHSMSREMEELHIKESNLQNEFEQSQQGLPRALVELADCRASLEILQKENLDLTESLISEKDTRLNLMEEKEFLSIENKNLASDVLQHKEQLHSALGNQVHLQRNLMEIEAWFEQLAEENMCISSSLEVHKEKIKELQATFIELPSQVKESGSQGMPSLQKNCDKDHVHSVPGALKRHLEDANNILHDIEKSVEGMHFHTVSLNRSGGRVAASGISKIIQAFESKTVENDDATFIEGTHPEDLYTSTKEQMSSLRDTLMQMELEIGTTDMHLMEEPTRREHLNKFGEGSEIPEEQNSYLQRRIDELVEELSAYKSQIVNLQNHVNKMQQNTNEEVARLLNQLDDLQNEVNDSSSALRQKEDSIWSGIVEAVEKLNTSTELQLSDGLDVGSQILTSVDAAVLAINSLHEKLEASYLNYSTLQTSFEETNKSFADIQERNELAVELLKNVYSKLKEFVYDSNQDVGEALMEANTYATLQFLPEKFDLLMDHLQKFTEKQEYALLTKNELELKLLNKNHEIEELNMRCNALSKSLEDECCSKEEFESMLMNRSKTSEVLNNGVVALVHMLENCKLSNDLDTVSMLMKSDNSETDFSQSMLLRLEALVSFFLQKYGEVFEQINSSKDYLQELDIVRDISAEKWSLPLPTFLRQEFVPHVIKLQEKLQSLNASNLQKETELQILEEGLSKMKEALEASRLELNLKTSEVEQSEQRLSSVREKLSIAVAKGKGLVVQRDSLKQSLAEKTSELEKCMQELQSKETMLHEVEAKLKSCSEVDRVEALESELSYIRNSATALRDSFLLKDSVLQRIEEVLEDLDLPEQFHSRDIVEKIELLSRWVAGNSSVAATDWDQKSFDGRSHSDAGFPLMDAWKDEIQTNPNQELDELKRKYEELQSKFYGLAEHNDMLEQSLLERNKLVQKWEDLIDRIDMPSCLRTLEPEDRIESLGRAFSDIQEERDTLLQKIENLEDSSDMLIVDLEESHKKISELSAEVVTVRSEKDFFSESLDKLRFQNLALSEKAVQYDVERQNLRRELANLQEKLAEKVKGSDQHDIQNDIHELNMLVCNALLDSNELESTPSEVGIASFGALLRRLIDNYTKLSLEKSKDELADTAEGSDRSNSVLQGESLVDALQHKDQELSGLRSEIEIASQSLLSVKEERDAAVKRCHSLSLEIDEINSRMNFLQEERTHVTEKYQSLVLELEAVGKDRDNLQEKLIQEDQKSAALREKLNVAVRKGKGLVQQRDALKQKIEELSTALECLKSEHDQHRGTFESEKSLLMNQLAESEQNLRESSQNLSRLLAVVHSINIDTAVNIIDPIQKLEEIVKVNRDLHSAVVSSEFEAKKSKQAAQLLLNELNEVQDRADILQEELTKMQAALSESYKQQYDAEAAKIDAVSRLEQFVTIHSEERKKQAGSLMDLKSCISQLSKGCSELSYLLSNVTRKDVDLLSYLQSFLESLLNGEESTSLPFPSSVLSINPTIEENSHALSENLQLQMNSHFDEGLIAEHLAHACFSLHERVKEYGALKEKIDKDIFSSRQLATGLLKALDAVKGKLSSQKEFSESLKEDVKNLKLVIEDKNIEISSMHRNLSRLYEACRYSILEIEKKNSQIVGDVLPLEGHVSEICREDKTPPSWDNAKEHDVGHPISYTDHSVRMMADSLLMIVKGSSNTNEVAEADKMELKASIVDLQRALQEKDIEMKRTSEDLVCQVREAEALTNRYVKDLDSTRTQLSSLEKAVAALKNDKQLSELRISQLEDCEASSNDLQDKLKSLTDIVAAKDQEIDDLLQALDEEELKMEALEEKNKELEVTIQEKILVLENLEKSRAKALANLSTTVSKFDELRSLSESLLTEVESLQSQLQERDSEISFLRQEVTRCTNDALASEETNKKYSSEIDWLLTWMEMMVLRFGEPHVDTYDQKCSQIHVYADILDKRVLSVMNELEDLRLTIQSKDALLQIERGRVEKLLHKTVDLESLRDEETQREYLQGDRSSAQPSASNSPGSVEIEQMVQRNKVSSAPVVKHIRSGRKVNNDQIAIAIDMAKDDSLVDEDDDKAHGFTSLTMSRLVPRASRPIADRIDGIWVSAERFLMRQPSVRLGVIIYWVLLHALLASAI